MEAIDSRDVCSSKQKSSDCTRLVVLKAPNIFYLKNWYFSGNPDLVSQDNPQICCEQFCVRAIFPLLYHRAEDS